MNNTVEIIAIGNELLIGHTLDTNSNWIAKQLNRIGWKLERVSIIRDSTTTIASEVRDSLRRQPSLLITTGGLGPTHDDMTVQGVSLAMKKRLVLNKTALAMVRKKYVTMSLPAELTGPRRKMATLPEGAEPLPNPVGTAPGVLVRRGTTRIVSLPGVPEELKAIFLSSLIQILKQSALTRPREVRLQLAGIIESALAPVLSRAQKRYRGVYFKSHPRGRETGIRSLIRLHIYNSKSRAEEQVWEAAAYVLKGLSAVA